MIDLSIIIVNYNVREFLEQALHSVNEAVEGISHEIFVVDNASTDGSSRMVREKFPDVKLIENSANVGFARANNMAIKESRGRIVTLLNPDTLVSEDTFSVILKSFDENREAGMIGCKVLNPDGTLQLSCRRSFPTPWVSLTRMLGLSRIFPKSRLFGRYNLTYLDENKSAEVDAISGSFMSVRREVIETAGMLDEQYFMYGEDLEWCYQIRDSGWKILYIPDTSIVHYKGESSRQSNWNQLKLFYKAMEIFSEKHFKSYSFLTPLWLLKVSIWLRAALTLFVRTVKSLFVPAIDVAMVYAAMMLAYYIRFGGLIDLPFYGDYRDYMVIGGISSGVILLAMFFQGVYPRHRYSVHRTLRGALWGSLAAVLTIFFSRWLAVSRLVLLMSIVFQITFLTGWRVILKALVRMFSGSGLIPFGDELRPARNIVIGTDPDSIEIYRKFRDHPVFSRQSAGVVEVDGTEAETPGTDVPVLGHLSEIIGIIREHRITDLIFAAGSHSYQLIIDTVARCQQTGVSFKLVPNSMQLIIGKSSVIPFGEVPLVDIEYRFLEGTNRTLKRMMDIVLASLLITVTFPAYFVLKLTKKLRSVSRLILGQRGAPVYIRQVMYKGEPYTGWARFFPLWCHVFTGDISFVGTGIRFGPQSTLPPLSLLKPGIISLESVDIMNPASLNGHTFELTYLKNYTILYDLKILLRSFTREKKERI